MYHLIIDLKFSKSQQTYFRIGWRIPQQNLGIMDDLGVLGHRPIFFAGE